jgi:DNA-binding transcriptional MocR family regulator
VIPVPTDDAGIDLGVLEQRLKEQQPKFADRVTDFQPFWGMIYLVPTYNNPRGYCIPPDHCKALVQLARKYKVLIFCDDVYNLLHFDPDTVAPPRLLSYDKPSDPDYQGNVISNSSFSKILSPGLRLGWIEAGDFIIKKLVGSNILWSAGSSNHYGSEVVASALELGLEQAYLKGLNAEYKDTVERVTKVLSDNLPKSVKFNSPKGGYFIWIEMPQGAKSADVITECLTKYKVKALVGHMCSATGGSENCIRISFSHYPPDVLEDAVKKLCLVITQYLEKL